MTTIAFIMSSFINDPLKFGRRITQNGL
jgi:hypothetical protein